MHPSTLAWLASPTSLLSKRISANLHTRKTNTTMALQGEARDQRQNQIKKVSKKYWTNSQCPMWSTPRCHFGRPANITWEEKRVIYLVISLHYICCWPQMPWVRLGRDDSHRASTAHYNKHKCIQACKVCCPRTHRECEKGRGSNCQLPCSWAIHSNCRCHG